jgi:hypothetical protein
VSYSAARSSEVPKFDVVDAVTPVGAAPCAECRGAIVDTYYESDEGVVCAACHARITSASALETPRGQFSRALGFGVLAASIVAAVYFALLAAMGREMSLALVLVGFAVGKAVRTGARRRGGRRLQWLALGLTYLAMVLTYVPFVLKGSAAADLGALLLLAAAAPILEGIDHGLTLIMIAIALGQAWRMNRRAEQKLTGPFRVRVARA